MELVDLCLFVKNTYLIINIRLGLVDNAEGDKNISFVQYSLCVGKSIDVICANKDKNKIYILNIINLHMLIN